TRPLLLEAGRGPLRPHGTRPPPLPPRGGRKALLLGDERDGPDGVPADLGALRSLSPPDGPPPEPPPGKSRSPPLSRPALSRGSAWRRGRVPRGRPGRRSTPAAEASAPPPSRPLCRPRSRRRRPPWRRSDPGGPWRERG